jgi:hypothetical protein
MTRVRFAAFLALVAAAASAAEPQKKPVTKVIAAKASFITAAEVCLGPTFFQCDVARAYRAGQGFVEPVNIVINMRERGQEEFVAVCETCASPEVCEAERLKIREGKASSTFNPCRCENKKVAKTEGCQLSEPASPTPTGDGSSKD